MANEKHTGLDFDGTVTDVEREALSYLEGYKADVANQLSLPREDLDAMWGPIEAEILASPAIFGWPDNGGRIVAPATADPLILARVIADQILFRLRNNPEGLNISASLSLTDALPQDAAARGQLLDHFFANNSGKMETHFRPGASDFLASLLELGRLTVITNSKTQRVQAKLATLRQSHPALPEIEVRGWAEKYTIVPDFVIDGMAAELDCRPHLARPVFTQRGKYFDVLRESAILEAHTQVVAGDVWELDLMLPILLKMRVAFITRPMTPEHEKAIVSREISRGMARISDNLEGLLSDIRELHRA